MNNLVFNTVSSQLHTLVDNVSLTVAGGIEVTNTSLTVAGSVEVTNTSLTVAGSVEVTNTSLTVAVGNTSLTVAGSVEVTNTSLTVAGDMTVAGHTVTGSNTTLNGVTGTGIVFADTDISQVTTGSFFVYNNGTSPFTISLQVSPAPTDALYAYDVDNDNLPVDAGDKLIIAISKYGMYARLEYDAASAATFDAYYVGQM